MATTQEVIEAAIARLKAYVRPALAVEYFPERPADYRLNHPVGALLVSFPGARYSRPLDTDAVVQERELRLSVAVVMRQLNGRDGAVAVVDRVRTALVGWRAPDCQKTRALAETFLGEKAGLWQYAVDVAMQTMVVEDLAEPELPLLTQVNYEENE